ncbi:1219_t:CDS:10 [Entrophospora sp. SA101]|nr:5081_t:CDS:10 [Entrophospora sp. SA101]CAJ0900353.1 1219_t:CDS:10 [Entrophospora sp. SA101]
MGEEILDVIDPLLVYTILGGFILFYGLVSLIVKEKLYLSEAFVATFVGLIVGPACLNWINPMHWENKDQVTEELTRIVLAIQVMAAGINLPRAYITRQFTSMAIMLLPVMIWMWITSAVIIYHFISELTFLESLLIASCITPTDPILANSVVQGSFAEKYIPSNVRHLLSAESGANDGMGFPFMFLALYLLQKSNTTGSAISQWIYFVWGYHILFSIVIGIIIGWGAKKLLEIAGSKNWIDKESFLVFAIALAIFVVGGVSILGSDALLSCFTAGSILAWDDWFQQETRDAHLQEVIDLLLTLTTFTYIGMIVPWSRFNSDILSLQRLIPISILILIFRRLPIVLTLKKFIPAIHTFKEAMFAGYFGPIGVGAVFLAMTVKNEVEKRENDMDANIANRTKDNVFPIVAFIVISSVVVHGITVPILNIGSRIDIERLPTIASISDQVARLPIVDFVESLSVEHDAQGSVQEEEGIDESDNSVKDEMKTNILIDLGNGDDEEVDNQSQSSKNKLSSRNSSESVDNISSDYNNNNQNNQK